MPELKCSDDEFVEAWKRLGSISLVAHELGLSIRRANERRRVIENRHGMLLDAFNDRRGFKMLHPENKVRSIANISGCDRVFGCSLHAR